VQSDGSWSTSVTLSGDGAHSIIAQDTDAAGNIGTSAAVTFTLDTAAPTVAIGTAGGLTNHASQTISGTVGVADAGTSIKLYDNGSATVLGTAVVQSDGSWSTSVTMSGDGAHSIVAQDTDAAGNIGTSAPVTFTLQTSQPTNHAPVITSSATFALAENHTAVGIVTAVDAEHDAFSFALAGGSDQAFFSIDAHSGAFNFLASPDFETPEDANHDNVYDLIVSATDVLGASSNQTIHVSVTNVAETGQTANGGNGNDVLTGTTGNDTMSGGNGDDTLNGGDGNDNISGGNGNDTLTGGRGDDVLDGGDGNDTVDGGSGNNQLSGGNGNDTLRAGDGNNLLDGGNGNDILIAGNGNNTLTGGNGNDTITAGNGNNTITAGNGNENVTVGNGNSTITGGNGNDTFHVGTGNNTLTGGNGNDSFVFGPGFGEDVITDFAHGDQIEFVSVFANFAAVQTAMHQVGVDTVISLDADHAVTLTHVTASSLHASDFLLA
jgi:Ca2+-binding RTX toxin-like protein